jgi:hypothetical protein
MYVFLRFEGTEQLAADQECFNKNYNYLRVIEKTRCFKAEDG